MEGGREEQMKGWRDDRCIEGGMEGWREGWREGGRDVGMEGWKERKRDVISRNLLDSKALLKTL